MKDMERVKRMLLLVLSAIALPIQFIVLIGAIYVAAIQCIKELKISFRLADIKLKKKDGLTYGSYLPQENTIFIYVLRMFKFSKKKGVFVLDITNAVDTVRHELRHVWQHQQGLLVRSVLDVAMYRMLVNYLGEQEVARQYAYLWSWPEVDARAYAEGGLAAASEVLNDDDLEEWIEQVGWYNSKDFLAVVKRARHVHLRGVYEVQEQ